MKLLKILILTSLFPSLVFSITNLSLKGYYKNFFVVFEQPVINLQIIQDQSRQQYFGMVDKRLRLQMVYSSKSWYSVAIAYDFSSRIQDANLFSNSFFVNLSNPYVYRVADINQRIFPDSEHPSTSFALYQNLDRAFVTISVPFADMYVGRQVIAWGSARVINPTDVIAPFAFNELDKEERFGVDALRIRVPLGFMGEFDTGYVFGKNFEFNKSVYYIRGKFFVSQTNITLLSLGFQENLLIGVDVARSIGGAGFWLEAALVLPKALAKSNPDDMNNYFRSSIGLDYSLNDKTYGFIEYHFNQAGAGSPQNYLSNLSHIAYTEGSVYLLGRHYLAPGVTYQINPLITLTATSLFNITDRSLYLAPSVEYNIAENIYVTAGAYAAFGKSIQDSRIRSEFGIYPNTFFTSFKIYF